MCFPPFGKLKASKDRIYNCRGIEEWNPQQVANAQKFIFVVQDETCSSYTEFCTYERPSILSVVTENEMIFPNKVNIS